MWLRRTPERGTRVRSWWPNVPLANLKSSHIIPVHGYWTLVGTTKERETPVVLKRLRDQSHRLPASHPQMPANSGLEGVTTARTRRLARGLSIITVALLILGQAQPALADYNHTGSGQWTTSSLSYYFYGPDGTYQSPTQAAATDWNDMSDLTVSATAEGWEKIGVGTGAYGTGFNGRTVICGVSGTCYSSIPINENFNYAQIDFNTSTTSGWSWGALRALANHEFGHAFSLWHVPYCDPVDHIMFTPVTHSCNGGAQYPQPHDIDGVNVRY